MAEANLNIRIGADTSQVDKAIDKLTSELGKFNAAIDRGDKDAFKNLSASLNRIQKDIKGINPQLDGLLGRLRDQTLKLSVETDTKSIEKLKADISQTQRLISGLKGVPPQVAQSFDKVKASSNGASQGILSFSRVISDAPFGIIGIANNLEQLPLAFQQIKKTAQESGKTIGATLVGALTGPAGLGLALSAVTAAFTFASIGFEAWTRGFGKGKDEVDKYKKRIDELRESLKSIEQIRLDAAAGSEGDISYVNALAQAVTDANKPYAERKRALDELKKVNKEYFGDLTVETAAYGALAQRVQQYSEQLVQQAVVKALQDQISANTALRLELERRLKVQKNEKDLQEKIVDKQRQQNKELSKTVQGGLALAAAGQGSTGLGGLIDANAESRLGTLTDAYKKTRDELEKVNFDIANYQYEINKEVAKILKEPKINTNSIDELNKRLKETQDLLAKATNPEDAKKYKNEIIEIKKQLKSLNPSIPTVKANKGDVVSAEEAANKLLQLENDLQADLAALKAKGATSELQRIKLEGAARIQEIKKQYENEKREISQKVFANEADRKKILDQLEKGYKAREVAIVTNVLFKISEFNKSYFDFTKNLKNKVDNEIRNKPISFSFPAEIRAKLKLTDADKEKDNIEKQLQQIKENIKGALETTAEDSFAALGDAFGSALGSGGSIGQALGKAGEALLKVVGGVLQTVGKQIIAASALVQTLKKALSTLFANPAAGVAVGVGLVALGSLLKSIKVAKIPAFAEGGIVTKPTIGMIGEAGKEAVIPLDQLAGIIQKTIYGISGRGVNGAAMQSGKLVAEVRGSTLAFVLQRTNQTTNRLG